MARIGILSSGLHGHLQPAGRLGRALAARGHAVVAWAPEEVRDLIEQGGVELRAEGAILDGKPNRDFMLGAALAAVQAAEEVGPVIERLHSDRIDLVVHDCMFPAGRLAAEWLGLPRVCSVPLFLPALGVSQLPKRPIKPAPPTLRANSWCGRYTTAARSSVSGGASSSAGSVRSPRIRAT